MEKEFVFWRSWLFQFAFCALLRGIASEVYDYTYKGNRYDLSTTRLDYKRLATALFCNASSDVVENMDSLKSFKALETIDARSCGVNKINFNIIIKHGEESFFLDSLHTVDYSKNKIESLEKYCFYSLQNGLKTLNLSNNIITHFVTEAFYELRELENLDLSNNIITYINQTSFKDLEKLKNFNLAKNQLQILHFELFSNSRQLEFLNFSSNLINDTSVPSLVWKSLHTLDLSNNSIYQLDMSTAFPNLKHFHISPKPANEEELPTPSESRSTPEPSMTKYAELAKMNSRLLLYLVAYISIFTLLLLAVGLPVCCKRNPENSASKPVRPQPPTTTNNLIDMNPIYETAK